jgi:hypothetical protein
MSSKKPPTKDTINPPPKPGPADAGTTTKIDVGDLTEAVTRSITRALGVRDAARLPIRIICGIIAEPPDFFRGGGSAGGGQV